VSDRKLTIHRYRMPDTGIGQEMGFQSDDAFRDHVAAERAKLPAEVREKVEAIEQDFVRAVMFGTPAPTRKDGDDS
jgi:hypothetical protein